MNLKCKDCEEVFESPHRVKIVVSKENVKFKTFGKAIVCPKCKSENLKSFVEGNFSSNFLTFTSKPANEKAKFFQERAKKHAATKVEKEKRDMISRNADNQLRDNFINSVKK